MSRSIYTTYSKNIFGLTKKQIDEQDNYPNSDLTCLAKKSTIKSSVKKNRKISKNENSRTKSIDNDN